MSAKTFVKINILLYSISIHVEIHMNSDGLAIKLKGLDHKHSKCEKLLTIRFKLKHLHQQSVTFLALYIFVKK